MKTLVYFASGPYEEQYQSLPFDQVYLVDYCFRGTSPQTLGKVVCLGMDCLEAVNYLKEHSVKIDFFVSLNEGLFQGGGNYAINSEIFLGYVMPLLKEEYYHLMNRSYYPWFHNVTMDLPYDKVEIFEDDENFLDWRIFSAMEDSYHLGKAKVFRMKKIDSLVQLKSFGLKCIEVKNESIWCDYDELDLLCISNSRRFFDDNFFLKRGKVLNIRDSSFEEVLDYCVRNKIEKVGFTPWLCGKYEEVLVYLGSYDKDYPKSITFYHLNKNDYTKMKSFRVLH